LTVGTRQPTSLQRRLTLTALGGLMVVLALGAWGLSASFAAAVERGFDERLKTVLQILVAEAETTGDGALVLSRPMGDPRFERIYSGSYWQISNAGGVLLRSRSLWDQEIPHGVAPPDGTTLFRYWVNPFGQSVRLAERDLTLPDRPEVLHFIVAGRTADIEAELRRFDQLLLLGMAALGVLLSLTVAVQIRLGLRPLRRLLDDLHAVWQGQRNRVDETLPRELRPLAVSVNQLLNHDDREIVRARDQAADLAHAIKTPLAVLRADIDSLNTPLAAGMRERLDLIDGLVRRNLARAAPGRTKAMSALGAPVRPVAEQMAALMQRVHPDRTVTMVLAVPDELYVRLDQQDLEEMLGNLLDNAWKWARSQVRLSATVRGETATIVLEDDGPGLPAEDRELVLGRRVRLDERTAGQGLGLPIVRDIVAAGGGQLELAHSSMGGLAVRIILPLARPF
jgi:signal transduction histidine kinase